MNKSRLLTFAACLALVGGVAIAAANQSIVVAAGASGIDAVLIPGASGGSVVLADYWEQEIDLKVDFDPSGTLSINGGMVAEVSTADCYSVHIDLMQSAEGQMAFVTVTNNCTNAVVCSAIGVNLGVDAPRTATAAGDEVFGLSAE